MEFQCVSTQRNPLKDSRSMKNGYRRKESHSRLRIIASHLFKLNIPFRNVYLGVSHPIRNSTCGTRHTQLKSSFWHEANQIFLLLFITIYKIIIFCIIIINVVKVSIKLYMTGKIAFCRIRILNMISNV